jgi:hypothetical protein
MRSVKNGELFEAIPARSFHRLASLSPTPCQTRQTGETRSRPRHGYLQTQILPGSAGKVYRMVIGWTGLLDGSLQGR